jgi:membrane protein required for colicin V production
MNGLDIILLAAFIPAIIRGLKKGFLEQLLALAGIVAGVWAAYQFSALVSDWLRPHIDASDTLLGVIAFVLILVVVSLGIFLITKLLCKIISTSLIGWVDKLLGVVAGCIVTALLLCPLIISFETLNTQFTLTESPLIKNSVVYNFLKDAGYFVFPYLKQLLMQS